MLLQKRKYPIGTQDFNNLRQGGYVYVDKTVFIDKLLNDSRQFFLSRPRRFGKSLFLSTLSYYFQGRKDLFEGLYIAEVEKEWAEYPVLHIDFNVGALMNAENLAERISLILNEFEQLWGQTIATTDLPSRFEAVIKSAYKKTGKGVVVLIDEYDKPLLNTINDPTANDEIRTTLKSFYGVLKSADIYLKLVFITGVTKFNKVSIFS
ncbi:MAG: AAA family ATPase, partial [Tannerella sp.]|nr:AAA family ATPase [Tannerella sp.]